MARRIYLLVPSAVACLIFGCGGASDPGLFSAGGGKSGVSGASSAGAASLPNAGSTSAGGDTSNAGSVGDAGSDSAGGSNSAGSDNGGAGEAGHSGSGEQAGTGGSSGHAEGGSSGHAEGGSAGHAAGGAAGSGVAGGAGSGSGGQGSAGGGNEPTCAELFTQAATELTAARACNVGANAEQCTGKVDTTCNCQVPVEKDDSPATKAYLATLKQLQSKHCSQVCPAIACTPVFNTQCRASSAGSKQGTCVASFPVGVPEPQF
jgi:hypothetical protein